MRRSHVPIQTYCHDILYAVLLVMLRTGASVKDITAITAAVLAAAKSNLRENRSADPALSVVVAGVLHRWHHDRNFLDFNAVPRPLAADSGRCSLVSLVRRENRKVNATSVVNAMRRLKLIRRHRDGRYRPTTRVATIQELDPVLAEHVCHSLGRLLLTVSNNTRHGTNGQRLIERSAQVHDLPRSQLREFRDFANVQGETFVSSINDWLEARRARNTENSRSRTAHAGIHLFAFVDPPPKSQRFRAAMR
jgi:hypothetical protein